MEIKEIQANKGNVEIVGEVVKKESPRAFDKFGKKGQVCNAQIKDVSGEVTLTLWNEDVDKIKVGDKIRLVNGWCSEYKGEKQVSTGKFGKIEVLESKPEPLLTNDPAQLEKMAGLMAGDGDDDGDDGDDEEEELDLMEENVE